MSDSTPRWLDRGWGSGTGGVCSIECVVWILATMRRRESARIPNEIIFFIIFFLLQNSSLLRMPSSFKIKSKQATNWFLSHSLSLSLSLSPSLSFSLSLSLCFFRPLLLSFYSFSSILLSPFSSPLISSHLISSNLISSRVISSKPIIIEINPILLLY